MQHDPPPPPGLLWRLFVPLAAILVIGGVLGFFVFQLGGKWYRLPFGSGEEVESSQPDPWAAHRASAEAEAAVSAEETMTGEDLWDDHGASGGEAPHRKGERLLSFRDREQMNAWLELARSRGFQVDVNEELLVARVRFGDDEAAWQRFLRTGRRKV